MKRLIITLLLTLGIGSVFAFATPAAYAQNTTPAPTGAKAEICNGVGAATGGTGCATPQGGASVDGLIKTVVNVLSWLVGVISVIMIIVGGFQYVTSGGDSGKISGAKNTIIYAIIGLIIVAFSQAIVVFVLSNI